MAWHITPTTILSLQGYLCPTLEAMDCFLHHIMPIQAVAVVCHFHLVIFLQHHLVPNCFSVHLLLLHQHLLFTQWKVIQDNPTTMFRSLAQVPKSWSVFLSSNLFIQPIQLLIDAFQHHLVPNFLIQITTMIVANQIRVVVLLVLEAPHRGSFLMQTMWITLNPGHSFHQLFKRLKHMI